MKKTLKTEAIAIIGGGAGGFLGNVTSQITETGRLDLTKALEAGKVTAIVSGFAGVIGNVPTKILLSTGAGIAEKITGSILQVDGGAEIVIYTDKYVVEQTYPGASFIVATYVYGGGGLSETPTFISDKIVSKAITDISSGMKTSPVSGSASVFAVLGNEDFNSPESYTRWFTTYSGTVKHVKGYYSSSETAKSIGLGYSTSLFSVDFAETYYVLLDEAPFGIPNDGYFDALEGLAG